MIELNGWFFVLVANFLILMYLLNLLLFKPLITMFKERERIRASVLEEARSLEMKADKAMTALKTEMAIAHDKANAEFMKLRQEGLIIQKELITKSHDESVKLLSVALKEISVKGQEARLSLKEDIQRYADEIVNKLLYEHIRRA
ncbi:MAG: hypothetical protein HQK89_03490 [Nitrospirae bacterium]|nr:hypothetical protein [Nitrospirota bacterium]